MKLRHHVITATTAIALVVTVPTIAKGQCSASSKKVSWSETANSPNLVETAVAAGDFTTLVAAVQAAGLVDALSGSEKYTVLAPTDEAFAKLPEGTLQSLLQPENHEQLKAILTYHVIPGKVKSGQVATLSGAETLNGQRVDIAVKDGTVTIDNASVIKADIVTSNGVIHVIDRVILPESKNLVEVAQGAEKFNTLIAAAKAAGLADTLSNEGPYTVFAPTDEAFSKLPSGTVDTLLLPENRDTLQKILKTHVVSGRVYSEKVVASGSVDSLSGEKLNVSIEGGGASINGSSILSTDIDAGNGVVHIIDSVILPSEDNAQGG